VHAIELPLSSLDEHATLTRALRVQARGPVAEVVSSNRIIPSEGEESIHGTR